MSDDSIRIEYNEDLKLLEELLEEVKRPGDFFVSGVVEMPMPKVEIAGAGVLSFPVPPTQIAALIQQATRAPYGRGEDTILDESVRKVWQLPPDQVRIGGKSWAVNFDGIVQRVIAGLGCEGMAVNVELYKMLVYDTGGFFLAHRDTEKAGGMFGTLVLVLPSAHRGGELVIRHAGREVVVDLSGAEFSEVSFAAFYADCAHEVKPVTEGNRVCLIYNLILQRGTKKSSSIQAPDYETEIAATAKLLKERLRRPDAPAKIAWLLEHQYSPDGLSFAGLKSADAARAKVLTQAAARAGCAAHLGIVHIEESGSAQETYYDYEPRRWRHYDNEEEEIGDAGGDEFEVIEVCDWRHYIAQWRNLRDEPVAFGEIPLASGELLPVGALDDEKPDEQRLMEASGNEGASFERSYHRAALVLWRRERYAEVLLQAGVAAALPYLKEKIEALPASRKEAIALARRMIQAWKPAPVYEFSGCFPSAKETTGARIEMLRLLTQLGDTALLEQFIAEVVTREYNGDDNAALLAAAPLLGAKATGACFAELIRRQMPRCHGKCAELFHGLVSRAVGVPPASSEDGSKSSKSETHGQDAVNALRQIAEVAVAALDEIGKASLREEHDHWWQNEEWPDELPPEKSHAIDAALAVNLLDALNELNAGQLRADAVEKFAARPEVFDPVTVLVPALAGIRRQDDATAALWNHCVEFLLRRSGGPPVAPTDWRQEAKLSCSCADCRELQRFVLDPAEQTHRFRVRKDRRQHLHQQIERHRLDMTHVTERRGSPQTLVCTKDRRSYRRRCEQYRRDVAGLASLAKWAVQNHAPATVLKDIESARALASSWKPAKT